MIKRFLNTLGLATAADLQKTNAKIRKLDSQLDEELMNLSRVVTRVETFQKNQTTYLGLKLDELEQSIQDLAACPDSTDNAEEIDALRSRLDDLEDDTNEPLTKENFDIDDHFDIDNYQGEIDTMINNEIDYAHSFVDSSDIETMIEQAVEEFKTENFEDPDASMEQIVTMVAEKIGGAILGLTHQEPEPKPESTEYVDPVLQEIIINDPLLTILDED